MKPVGNLVRQFVAEILGTFVFLLIALGSVAQVVIAGAIGIFLVAEISGGHLNPAVSLALAINGRFDWKALPVYAIAQTIGAFLAAAVVYGLYSVGINSLAPDAAVHIFATAPNGIYTDDGSHGILFADQVIGTMILVLTVLSVTDSRNNVSPGIAPIMIGLAIGGVGMSFGFNCGFAINPARDFGPRLFTSLIYGTSVFHEHNYFFWVPIVGPLVGGAIGGGAYKLLTEILVLQQSPKISEI